MAVETAIVETVEAASAGPPFQMPSKPADTFRRDKPGGSPTLAFEAFSNPSEPAPTAPTRTKSPRMQAPGKPIWLHAVPAALLGLALLGVVAGDLLGGNSHANVHSQLQGGSNPADWTYGNLADPRPKLLLQFNPDNQRFGLQMTEGFDPKDPDKHKLLTAYAQGDSNNTIVNINGAEYLFGERTPTNRWEDGKAWSTLPNGRHGRFSIMDFTAEKVRVRQHVEIVPGESGTLDTCLVWYQITNHGTAAQKVGLRFMLDTYIGANDGVPFTAPGVKGFIDSKKEFKGTEVPPYLEAVENSDNPDDPGTIARSGSERPPSAGPDLGGAE